MGSDGCKRVWVSGGQAGSRDPGRTGGAVAAPAASNLGQGGGGPSRPSRPRARGLRVPKDATSACGSSRLQPRFREPSAEAAGLRNPLSPRLPGGGGAHQPPPALRACPSPGFFSTLRPLLALLPRTALGGGGQEACVPCALSVHKALTTESGPGPLIQSRVGSCCPPTCLPSPGEAGWFPAGSWEFSPPSDISCLSSFIPACWVTCALLQARQPPPRPTCRMPPGLRGPALAPLSPPTEQGCGLLSWDGGADTCGPPPHLAGSQGGR